MKPLTFIFLFFLTLPKTYAQDTAAFMLSVDDLFSRAEKNSRQLAVSREDVGISRQQAEIAKSARLPEIGATVDAGFISSALVLNPNFSYNETVPVPHLSNNFSLQAEQTLYQGGAIRNRISRAGLQEQLAGLNFEKDRQTVKILLLGRYLDLYRLFNQRRVYETNIALARARLKNIEDLNTEGMVTKNDIIRSKLQITELNLSLDQVNDQVEIINHELCLVLNLPASSRVIPDTTLTRELLPESSYQEYLDQAMRERPAMKATLVKAQIADKDIRIAKAEKLPVLKMYAGGTMTRPYIYILPPLDIYLGLYQAGLRLQYNVSSLYEAKDHIGLAKLQRDRDERETDLAREQAELEVNAAFINYQQAKKELHTREESRRLADDNYRIVENKYLNQLALLTDILDASSAKLAAELNQSNAGLTIVYRWYQLQKASGNF